MRVCFTSDKEWVVFLHEDGKEYKYLSEFPAFVKVGPYNAVPAKLHVLHNVVSRLQKAKRKLAIDRDVYDFLQQPFQLKEIPASFRFHTEPMDYQRIALRYLWTVGSGGLLLDPGMGKTKVVLDYIVLAGFKKVLVVCPKPLLSVWTDEIEVHRPELSNYYVVQSMDWDKEKTSVESADVVIINYTKAVALDDFLANAGFDFMHLDEFLIKDPTTDRTKSLTKISKKIPFRCGGSGTLVNNTILDVFAPVRYLEPGLVGYNGSHFMARHTVKNPHNPKQVVGYKGIDEARAILESCSIVMTKDKWLKLPDKKFHDISVSLTPEQHEAYWQLTRNYLCKVGGQTVEVDNPLVMMSKLYQIANGFLYIADKEDEQVNEVSELLAEDPKRKKKRLKRNTVFFAESAKVKALRDLLCGKLSGKRAIIWFNMEAEYQMISKMLEELGHSFLTIKGGEADTGGKVRKFNRDNSIRWLVCQAKSVNYGVTVMGTSLEKLEELDIEPLPGISTDVHTEVFYSMSFSLEVYLQQQDRIHRLGQKHVCDYYRIFSSCPVEHRIRDAICDKMALKYEMLVDVAVSLLADSGKFNSE